MSTVSDGRVTTPSEPTAAPTTSARFADPAPWAVTAFATTSFALGMYNAGLLDAKGAPIVIPMALFFGGFIQIVVAILEFARGNLFGVAVFGTYGPFWVIYGTLQTLYASSIPAANLNSAVSLFLAVFAVVSFYLFLASLRTDVVLAVIIGLIVIGLALLSYGAASGAGWSTKAGGWVTLAFAVLAWYHAAGDIMASTFGRTVLPVWPLRR